MKTISQHIAHIKSRPHHIRKRVAFGAAAVGTGIIAFVWLVASVGTGTFALKTTSFADSTGGEGTLIVSDKNNDQLAGAGAAAIIQDAKEPARIQIIDAVSPTLPNKKAEQTVLPF